MLSTGIIKTKTCGMKVARRVRNSRRRFPRKVANVKRVRPVPRTDTRGQGEYPEVSEITVVKELCKITS